MMRSLYKSADIKNKMTITLDVEGVFRSVRGHYVVVFKPNSIVSSLYKSADMQNEMTISEWILTGGGQFRDQSPGQVT